MKESCLVDDKGTVSYEGTKMSAQAWGSAMKGWPSINVYEFLFIRSGNGSLTSLRDLRAEAVRRLAGAGDIVTA